MARVAPQATEKRPTVPGLPFLAVGNASRTRSARAKVGVEQPKKLFEWWYAAQPSLKQLSARDFGLPALKLAEQLGLDAPTNGNSFRANLQRKFDELNVDGKTMFLLVRGADGGKFKVTDETMVWFHPVAVSERERRAGEPCELGTKQTRRTPSFNSMSQRNAPTVRTHVCIGHAGCYIRYPRRQSGEIIAHLKGSEEECRCPRCADWPISVFALPPSKAEEPR